MKTDRERAKKAYHLVLCEEEEGEGIGFIEQALKEKGEESRMAGYVKGCKEVTGRMWKGRVEKEVDRALEEAAKVCNRRADEGGLGYGSYFKEAAEEIRKLKEK